LVWYEAKFQKTLAEIEDHFSKYRLSDALMAIYKLINDDFSSWLLEIVKPAYQQPIDKKTFDDIIEVLENNLKVLHPFMPFLTEEIWQYIADRTPEEALIIAKYPVVKDFDATIIADFEFATGVISGIRTIRKDKNISFKDAIELFVIDTEKNSKKFDAVIQKLTNAATIKTVLEKVKGASFRVKSNEYFVPISIENIDVEKEVKKLEAELKRAEGFLFGISKKLSNERFVANAPEQVITIERKKEADTIAKIETIRSSLKALK
jgi:valyl-tRNA synthetase